MPVLYVYEEDGVWEKCEVLGSVCYISVLSLFVSFIVLVWLHLNV